jgi:hypothetical protein
VATAPLRPSTLEAETDAIQNTLGRYRRAFNALDAGAAQAVWPTVNERSLSRAFDRLEEQDVSFENCSIDLKGVLAEVACSGTARYVPRVGSRTAQVETRRWRFNMRKGPTDWLIEGVEAR